jgi:hypothetical protein
MQKTITDIVQQNRKKFATILAEKPEFAYQLYKTGELQAISKAFGKELLLRQLDRLLEERNYLDRELSLIRFEDEEKSKEKEMMVASETNHFELLKSIWKKDNCKKYEGTLEHIEELNLMVGQIKSNIQSLVKFESNVSRESEETYVRTFKTLHEKEKECQKCHEQQAKLDDISLKLEALAEQLSLQGEERILLQSELSSKDERLKKANKALLKQETEYKSRIIQLEQELLKKDQAIKQLKREALDQNKGRFINSKDNYELTIKASNFDLSHYHK